MYIYNLFIYCDKQQKIITNTVNEVKLFQTQIIPRTHCDQMFHYRQPPHIQTPMLQQNNPIINYLYFKTTPPRVRVYGINGTLHNAKHQRLTSAVNNNIIL